MPGSGKPALLAAITTAIPLLVLYWAVDAGGGSVEPVAGLSLVAFGAVIAVLFGGVFRIANARP